MKIADCKNGDIVWVVNFITTSYSKVLQVEILGESKGEATLMPKKAVKVIEGKHTYNTELFYSQDCWLNREDAEAAADKMVFPSEYRTVKTKIGNSSQVSMRFCPHNDFVKMYDGNGDLICETEEDLVFEYVRAQIAKNRIEGCYLEFRGEKYELTKVANLHYKQEWPKDLFDLLNHYLSETLHADFEENTKKKVKSEKSSVINVDDCPVNEWVKMYDNEGKIICYTNSDVMYNWVRAEIKERKLEGCYLEFRGERIDIDKNGELKEYPKGLFDNHLEQLFRLC